DLTDIGYRQIEELALHLINVITYKKYVKINVIISPLTRTMKTAKVFLDKLQEKNIDCTITTLVNIVEYTGTNKEISSNLEKMGIKHDNWESFLIRVKSFNDYLKNELQEKDHDITMIFGHGLFLSVLLSYQGVQENIPGTFHTCFKLANCSISTVSYVSSDIERPWRMYNIGSTKHLSEDLIYDEYVF
ncbi:MAG: histidine phosphatase family protein, partial [Romboutsia sp.]|nr:histidine phosphatase family protein [Romboutsia sp.]